MENFSASSGIDLDMPDALDAEPEHNALVAAITDSVQREAELVAAWFSLQGFPAIAVEGHVTFSAQDAMSIALLIGWLETPAIPW